MRNFATQSGKSKGQFYTPAEVSRVIAKVIGINTATSQEQSIYDPTCGSGSLLLKAADETDVKITIYGQEMDNATYALARMNMILHGVEAPNILHYDTLSDNINDIQEKDRVDIVLANPPFGAGIRSEIQHNFPIKTGETAFLFLQKPLN
jgi:type I restriction enzyme M protein